MTNSTRRFSAALCAIVLIASLGAAQSTPSYKELPNFHKVSDTFYRGAQPLNDAAKKLAEVGIKTIINLRGEDEVSLDEKKQAEAAGLHYFSVPMPGLSGPSDEVVARVMSIIDNPENQPVFNFVLLLNRLLAVFLDEAIEQSFMNVLLETVEAKQPRQIHVICASLVPQLRELLGFIGGDVGVVLC